MINIKYNINKKIRHIHIFKFSFFLFFKICLFQFLLVFCFLCFPCNFSRVELQMMTMPMDGDVSALLLLLGDDLRDDASADCKLALADRKAQALV